MSEHRYDTPRKYLGGRPTDPIERKAIPDLLDVARYEDWLRRDHIRDPLRTDLIREDLGVSPFTWGALLNRVRRDEECAAAFPHLVKLLNDEHDERVEKRAPMEELKP